ncbi:MAG: alpha-amylase, partial [Desulfuromonadales bacterium]|nr:alpha-amylase [Desulfuromonadales bacterium]
AQAIQRRRPGSPASAGQLNLLALLNQTFRVVAELHLQQRGCSVGLQQLEVSGQSLALPQLASTLEHFTELFPPAAILRGSSRQQFLQGESTGENRRQTLVELFILAVQNSNPATGDLRELFDDAELRRRCPYQQTLAALDQQLGESSTPGALAGSLLRLLRAPLEAAPHSLAAQLEFVRQSWGDLLPPELLRGLLTAFDILQEEQQTRGGGPGPIPVPRFGRADLQYEEPERFSPDADWMSNVVLIAKTIYVWLDQLSRKYDRPICRLDQIPDQELDQLARWGFTGLWLIGIFERSPASERIKRRMGNPEAVASAYSLYDYAVSQELGGEEAVALLQERCRRRGIRLGCDVVPNHTGIYSKWTREHPDWYVQVDHPPYPAYQFSGENLSFADDVEIYIEDGYWNHADAAVVFKHVDRRDGRVRYIYHGNDGTHLPWNDTAQLNFLLPQVREAMIQTILRVARRYQIIRFDAAMTLAKKHFQRLWFPQPGGGAGVPSRAEHAMSREEFDRAFPVEFWREVVDRIAAEVPDTLLLAEAFWLMEGYFVRTLGMHRVYNSAFMNMLKTEDNAKYRSVLKNILEFNPEILKRFVNFMNNPDEATAVAQFGKADKYFGVAMLLATMPGLPMFGHGQIEGFEEKYGMEYRRAYKDELPDEAFIRHHEAQIFPLLRRRWLFSGSENFVMYDFWNDGGVNEDVFAYSNHSGGERALIAFHNRYAETGGWIRTSVPRRVKQGEQEVVQQPTLAEALQIRADDRHYLRFRDSRTGLEYLRSGRELHERGLFLQLGPYEYGAFLDWREIIDEDGSWGWLCHSLAGRPVESLDFEWKKVRYAPLIETFRRAVFPGLLRSLAAAFTDPQALRRDPVCANFFRQADAFYQALAPMVGLDAAPPSAAGLCPVLERLRRLADTKGDSKAETAALAAFGQGLPTAAPAGVRRDQFLRIGLPWLLLSRLGTFPGATPAQAAHWLEEYLLTPILQEILQT